MRRSLVTIAAAFAIAVPAIPHAQDTTAPATPPAAQPTTPAAPPAQAAPAQPEKHAGPGFSIQAEVGAGQGVRDVKTDTNVVYGAILGLHFPGPLGLEAEYQHAENDFQDTSVALKQDGILGHVRLEVPAGPVLPFLYGGVGWIRYKSSTDLVSGSTDKVVIPAGLGVEFRISPLILGARGEYQFGTSKIAGQTADFWKVVGTIGIRIP